MSINELVKKLAQQLLAQQYRVVTAESCTGGGIAQVMTSLAGSSNWFECGWITYSNAAKQRFLQIDAQLIEKQGAVSESVVLAMATAALQLAQVELSVAVSGVAGPDGGTTEKPVGTVWIAWAWQWPGYSLQQKAEVFHFQGDRESVRQQTVEQALSGLINLLKN